MKNTNILFLQLKAYNNAPSISLSRSCQLLQLCGIRKATVALRNYSCWLLMYKEDCLNLSKAKKRLHLLTPAQNKLK